MKEKYIPGEGCQCSARCSCECGCDVDWTPREVYELREQRDRLAEALRTLMFNSLRYRMESYDASYQEAESALAAVKGWSHDH
jgi:hypothetical protein